MFSEVLGIPQDIEPIWLNRRLEEFGIDQDTLQEISGVVTNIEEPPSNEAVRTLLVPDTYHRAFIYKLGRPVNVGGTVYPYLKIKGIGRTSMHVPFKQVRTIAEGNISSFSLVTSNRIGDILLGALTNDGALYDLLAWEILTGENQESDRPLKMPTIPVGIFRYKNSPYPKNVSLHDYVIYTHLVTTPIRFEHLLNGDKRKEYIMAQARESGIAIESATNAEVIYKELGIVFANNLISSLKAMVRAKLIHLNMNYHNVTGDGLILDYDDWVCLPNTLKKYGIRPTHNDIELKSNPFLYWHILFSNARSILYTAATSVFDAQDEIRLAWDSLGEWLKEQDPVIYTSYNNN